MSTNEAVLTSHMPRPPFCAVHGTGYTSGRGTNGCAPSGHLFCTPGMRGEGEGGKGSREGGREGHHCLSEVVAHSFSFEHFYTKGKSGGCVCVCVGGGGGGGEGGQLVGTVGHCIATFKV